jgi:iron complex outermembrane receptor protein
MAWCVLAFAAFALNANAALNEEEEALETAFGGEELISLATGRSQPISRAPAVATVITAEQIKEMGATNLDEVLETVAGVHVSLSSLRFSPLISIRGIFTDNNAQVLMLVNGVPITQVYLGDRGSRSTLPVASIQRVEVIRGPGSAIYGADAFAGVINVITKTARDIDGVESGIRYGSFDTKEGWVNYGGQWGEVETAFSVEYGNTDGDSGRRITSDTQTIFDNALGTDASLAPGSAETQMKRWDIRLDLSYKDWTLHAWNWRQSNVGVGPGLAQALDPSGNGDINNYLIDLSYHNEDLTRNWDLTGRTSHMRINSDSDQRLFPGGSVLPIGADGNLNTNNPTGLVLFTDGMRGNPGIDEDHYRFDTFAFFSGLNDHLVRLGAGLHYVDLDPKETLNFGPGVLDGTSLAPPPALNIVDGALTKVTNTPFIFVKSKDRTDLYASLQDEWSFATDWNLTAGIRYDHYSDFGDTVNPRLSLVWETRHDLTTKLLYGRAFRAPSFAELYNINNPVILGNPDLDPEKINYLELAFDYRPTFDIKTGLSLYTYKIKDLIRFVPDATGTSSTAENTGEQKAYGFELEAKWRVSEDFSIDGNYAYVHAEDETTNSNAGNAPKNQVYLIGKWRFMPQWFFSTDLNWVGDRDRVAGDPRQDIDNYTLVGLTLRRKDIVDGLSAALLVHNLFDKHASEPSPADPSAPQGALIPGDYPRAGRYIGGELRYRY